MNINTSDGSVGNEEVGNELIASFDDSRGHNEEVGNELVAAFDESRGHFVMVEKAHTAWDGAIREYVIRE